MKVIEFKKQMTVVHVLLLGWREVTSDDLRRMGWVYYLRKSAGILSRLAVELEQNMAFDGE